jgi:hypothetical protein
MLLSRCIAASAPFTAAKSARLILPESDPEWLRIVGNLSHDAEIGPFRSPTINPSGV